MIIAYAGAMRRNWREVSIYIFALFDGNFILKLEFSC